MKFTYDRVLPRDLFNEAKLLKCMGQLALLIHEGKGRKWKLNMEHITDQPEESGFVICQNLATGGLYVDNLCLQFRGSDIPVECDYNSKRPYPLVVMHPTCLCDVFDDDGTFSQAFKDYLDSLISKE